MSRDDESWDREITQLAATARDSGVPPEVLIIQVKQRVHRTHGRSAGTPLDAVMARTIRCAIREYYARASPGKVPIRSPVTDA